MKSAILGVTLIFSCLAVSAEDAKDQSQETPQGSRLEVQASRQESLASKPEAQVLRHDAQALDQEVSVPKQETQASSPEAVANQENSSFVLCRNNNKVRTIRVTLSGGGWCKAIYSKEGTEETVGRSVSADLCYDVVFKIRANLEKGPWKCKDTKPDRVSFTQE